jgi:hypothetical protein
VKGFAISVCSALAITALLPFGSAQSAAPQPANHPKAPGASGYRIAGRVVSKIDSHLLAGTRVTIRDTKDQTKFEFFITGDDGKFEFTNVPSGRYGLTGEKRGFLTAAYDEHDEFSSAIVTGAGVDTEHLTLQLAPNAVITGKVLDEAGEPVRRATVNLYRKDHSNGVEEIKHFRSAITDDLGVYEMTPLRRGTYFLAVSARPWYALHPNLQAGKTRSGEGATPADRTLDVAYPLTFYADVTDSDSATPISVRGGDRIEADVHLTPVPALRLLFRAPVNGGFNAPALQQSVFDGSVFVDSGGMQRVSRGWMELTGIPAGHYDVNLRAGDQRLQINGFSLSRDEQELDESAAEVLSRIKFSVKLAGEAPLPSRIFVGLRTGSKLLNGLQQADEKGELEFSQVPAGAYQVTVQGSATYSVARMTAEGAQVSGHTLTVGPATSASVSLTLAADSVDVQGTVKKTGSAFAGAMVVLVPRDPEKDHDLFRRDQSDLDGGFMLRGVIPGSYTLLAIENGWDLDWSRASVISAYLKNGKKIEISGHSGRVMKAEDAVEVQPE